VTETIESMTASLDWLLDPAFPTVRRLARSRLLDRTEPPEGPTAAEPWIETLLRETGHDGASDGGSPHPYQKWAGVHWRLVALAELDADPAEPAVARVVDDGFDRVAAWVNGDGRVKATRVIDERVRMCASIEGNAVWAAIRLGRGDDPRVATIVERLLDWQWPDGGWNCDKHPEARHASFNETLPPFRALTAYRRASATPLARDAATAADRTAEFLLAHRVDRSHRTGELAHPTIARLRWPAYWHYDRLQGLRALREAGRLDDPRTADALADLAASRGPDGRWRPDGRWWTKPRRADAGVEALDWTAEGESKMLTLLAMEVLAA
jgi:hypothetical protein